MASASNLITALRQVQPGDLITATFFNDLIRAIYQLEGRVSVLEAEGRFVVPEDGGAPVRQTLVINSVVAVRNERSISFKVFGSGLDPEGLKRFLLNDRQFTPVDLRGDDSLISFRMDLVSSGIHIGLDELRVVRETREGSFTGGSSLGLSTTLGAAAGARSRVSGAFGRVDERIADIGTTIEQIPVLTIEANSGARAHRRVDF